jgi:hypothetical protein
LCLVFFFLCSVVKDVRTELVKSEALVLYSR